MSATYFTHNAARAVLALSLIASPVVFTGCEKNNDGTQEAATISQAVETTETQPRPEDLQMAIKEIKRGQPELAEKRLLSYLETDADSTYMPEAHYLLGQAQAEQEKYEEAKKNLDIAIDKSNDRTLKALASFGRADCNMVLKKYELAHRQYRWVETFYRDVKAIPQDELLYKLGVAAKNGGYEDTANHWFSEVIELYATSSYAEKARQEHTKYTPTAESIKPPRVFTLEVDSFLTLEEAEKEARILSDKGYRDVQVRTGKLGDRKVYEVHVGKFSNQTDAVVAKTDAELAGLNTTIRPTFFELNTKSE